MYITAALKSFIYIVSSSLLYPVMFLLSLLIVVVLLLTGSFLAEWIERLTLKKVQSTKMLEHVNSGKIKGFFSHSVLKYHDSLKVVTAEGSNFSEAVIENMLQKAVLNLRKTLDKTAMIVRIGPGLGLIGTLIPMGTGLASLGQGDISKLSGDLVIAFTTTVAGLMVSLVAYFIHSVRKRWVEEDISLMEFITETLVQPEKNK